MSENSLEPKHVSALREKADKGNITAIQTLQKHERLERLRAAKEEHLSHAMFSKPESEKDKVKALQVMPSVRNATFQLDELDISEIEEYIQKGSFKTLPEHMSVYLSWMQEAHDWYYKFKSRTWVIRYLIANCKDAEENNISYYLAEKIFNDMLSFFYADKDFNRNSWLRYLAERIEMGAALALEDNDFETFGKNMERAAKVIGMIKTEKVDMDPRLLDRRPRFFITKTDELGLPKVDRYKLARQIDEMGITEKEKQRAKQDLGVEARDLTEGLEDEPE